MADDNNLPSTETAEPKGDLTVDAGQLQDARRLTAMKITDPLPPAVYERIGQWTLTAEQEALLDEPLDEEEVDIRPDGLIYVSHEYCRRVLNKAFGRMGWTLVPGSPLSKEPGVDQWYRVWILFVGGVYVSEAMASREYHANNKEMHLDDVAEAIKSDCVRRVCKDLGIAHEVWNRRFGEKWKREHAIQVVVQTRDRGNVKRWRRKDGDPLPNEVSAGSGRTTPPPPPPAAQQTKQDPPKQAPPPPAPEPKQETPPMAAKPHLELKTDAPGAKPPSQARTPAGKLISSQQRLVWQRARAAGLIVKLDEGEDYGMLIDILAQYVPAVPGDGQEATVRQMIANFPSVKLTEMLKAIEKAKAVDAEVAEHL